MTITQQEAQWIQETVEKLKTKWKPVTERNVGKIPYSSKDGVFDDYSPKDKVAWWTNGFWGGIMWQMYTLTGDDLYKKSAKELEDKLKAMKDRIELKEEPAILGDDEDESGEFDISVLGLDD